MSIQSFFINRAFAASDKKRDKAIPLPTGVTEHRDISYGPEMLDVYYPEGTQKPLPTIVSIHGGGYVYGTKELYRRYGMDMARRGFAFVNFNYRLAPKAKFPAPLEDTNKVLQWICQNAKQYHLDPERLFLVGDSAGAQLASQYAAIHTNPQYGALFGLEDPGVRILAVGLNCGMYDLKANSKKRTGINLDYFGRKLPATDPRLAVLENITKAYPPAFVTTGWYDFLRDAAEPMAAHLREKGIPVQCRCYGTAESKAVGHVFHVNILLSEAVQCNDDTAAFFRKYL